MALPMIYQNSRDAMGAAKDNDMMEDPSEENQETSETGPDETGESPDQESSEHMTEGPETDGEQASPQEQAQYDDLVTGGMAILYQNENTASDIARKLKSEAEEKGLSNAIGQQAAIIMLSLTRGLKQQKLVPDPDVVLNAGVEILSEIADIAQQAGLLPNEQYDKTIEEASYEATRFYGDQELKAGEITPEMRQQAQQAVSADQQGQQPKPQPGSLAQMTQPQGAM